MEEKQQLVSWWGAKYKHLDHISNLSFLTVSPRKWGKVTLSSNTPSRGSACDFFAAIFIVTLTLVVLLPRFHLFQNVDRGKKADEGIDLYEVTSQG